MTKFYFSKNVKLIMLGMTIFLLVTWFCANRSLGIEAYEKLDFITGLVTASALNVRSGPRLKL